MGALHRRAGDLPTLPQPDPHLLISGRDTSFTTWWTPWSGVDLSSGRFEDVQATALPHAGRVRARVTVTGAGASAQIRLRAEVRTS